MAKKKSVVRHSTKSYSPHSSPIIQIGVVFVVIAALFLMFYVGSLRTF